MSHKFFCLGTVSLANNQDMLIERTSTMQSFDLASPSVCRHLNFEGVSGFFQNPSISSQFMTSTFQYVADEI